MPNVMSFKNIKNKPHRSAFDLSYKNSFTAKVGELLPCFVKEVLPGDVFHLNPSHFTRTAPVNTAAYTRIRENVDFFFVPYRLLWDKWTQFIAQTDDPHYAMSFNDAAGSFTSTPFFTDSKLTTFIDNIGKHDGKKAEHVLWQDAIGMPMSMSTPKLLQYLGYGAYLYPFSIDGGETFSNGRAISPFRAAAYQKIYYDYYRNSQWEFSKPQCYNFDYIFNSSQLSLPLDQIGSVGVSVGVPIDCLFSMRYANYSKDLTNGLNPSAQFGDTAIAGPVLGDMFFKGTGSAASSNALLGNLTGTRQSGYPDKPWLQSLSADSRNTSGISVLAIRLAESLQKYREITLTGSKDYKDQIEKHWGVKVPDYASDLCQRVYSYDSMVEISEVVNTNVGNDSADIRGKGISSGSGGFTWKNDSNDYGVLMGIYHAEPLLDYQSDLFLDRNLLNVLPSSFPVPELDSIGMEAVPRFCVSFPTEDDGGYAYTDVVGYAPRYFEYKTSRDIIQGGFGSYGNVTVNSNTGVRVPQFNGGYNTWVSAYGKNFDSLFQSVNYRTFKINPSLLNSIFVSQVRFTPEYYDASVTYPDYSSDQLLVKSFFDCKVVRNLSYDGLPY